MRVKSIENITNHRVRIQFTSGMELDLPPDCTIENTDIILTDELKDKVLIVKDLTEVTRSSGKTQING